MTPDLYQPCNWCDNPDGAKFVDGTCMSCGGKKFFKIGLTLGQVDGLVRRSKRFYRADGSYEELHSERAVIERRKEAAREIERLTAECYELRDAADALRRIGELVGCDHLATADDRARLVRCVREALEESDAD